MEAIGIQILGQAAPILATIICLLLALALATLKKRLKLQMGKDALDQVDSVVQAVVGDLTQTMADRFKDAAKDGKLTDAEKKNLKVTTVLKTKKLLSGTVANTARQVVPNITDYISRKIEERGLAQKK